MKYLLYLFTPLLLSACGSDDSKTNQEGTTFPSDSTVVVGYRNPAAITVKKLSTKTVDNYPLNCV